MNWLIDHLFLLFIAVLCVWLLHVCYQILRAVKVRNTRSHRRVIEGRATQRGEIRFIPIGNAQRRGLN